MKRESTVYFVACPECGDKVPIPPQAIGKGRSHLWNVVACLNCSHSFDYDCNQINTLPLCQWYEMIGLQDQTKA